jgi:hypothetical protein
MNRRRYTDKNGNFDSDKFKYDQKIGDEDAGLFWSWIGLGVLTLLSTIIPPLIPATLIFYFLKFNKKNKIRNYKKETEQYRSKNPIQTNLSKGQGELKELVNDIFPNYQIIDNHRPKWLDGLEIDVDIPQLKLGFEFQGAQHYKPAWGGEASLKEIQENDKKKKQICFEEKYALVFIDYDENFNEAILSQKIKTAFEKVGRTLEFSLSSSKDLNIIIAESLNQKPELTFIIKRGFYRVLKKSKIKIIKDIFHTPMEKFYLKNKNEIEKPKIQIDKVDKKYIIKMNAQACKKYTKGKSGIVSLQDII